MNITEALARQSYETPNEVAIDFVEGALTFSELYSAVERLIAHLLELGTQSGDIIGLSFSDERLILISTFATTRLGAATFLVPENLPKQSKTEMISAVDLRFLLTDKRDENTPECDFSLLTFALLADIAPSSDRLPAAPEMKNCFMIVHGSGSTGRPKLINFSHQQVNRMCAHQRTRYGNEKGDVWVMFVNLSFRTPLLLAMSAVSGGNKFVRRISRIGIPQMPEFLRRHDVAFLYGTPNHVAQIVRGLPSNADHAFESLKGLILSFSSVNYDLRQAVRKKLTNNLYVSYGTNEVGLITILPPDAKDLDKGSVGYVIENNIVEVVDGSGKPVPCGTAGEIRVKNDQNFTGYVDDSEATRKAVRDGWFYPGDSGRFLPDGQLVHLGRSDQMMIYDGINIYPAEVERVMSELEGVQDVAVVPLTHSILGDVPACAFSLESNARIEHSQIAKSARARLGPRAPQLFLELPEIPRTDQGKVIRDILYKKIGSAWKAASNATNKGTPDQ